MFNHRTRLSSLRWARGERFVATCSTGYPMHTAPVFLHISRLFCHRSSSSYLFRVPGPSEHVHTKSEIIACPPGIACVLNMLATAEILVPLDTSFHLFNLEACQLALDTLLCNQLTSRSQQLVVNVYCIIPTMVTQAEECLSEWAATSHL